MEGKHTKGPWSYYQDTFFVNQAQVVPNDGGAIIATVYGDFDDESHDNENKGNACLISAAPELLEDLSELVRLKTIKDTDGKTPEYLDRQPKAWEQARAAIAKARGEG